MRYHLQSLQFLCEQKTKSVSMFLRNFMLFSQVVKTWRSSFGYNIRMFRRFNNSLYFKCDDVEKGLKQQYIGSKAYNNNDNEVKTSRNSLLNDGGSSNSSVVVRRGLKAVSSLIIISLASYIAYSHMDNLLLGIISIFIAIVTVLFVTGIWRWLYIAAITTPRDLMWVPFQSPLHRNLRPLYWFVIWKVNM